MGNFYPSVRGDNTGMAVSFLFNYGHHVENYFHQNRENVRAQNYGFDTPNHRFHDR